MLRKQFPTGGLGVRDLYFAGVHLYILAGPTMVLDGDIRLFRRPEDRRRAGGTTASQCASSRAFRGHDGPAAGLGHRADDRAEAFVKAARRDWCVARRRGWR